MRLSLKRYALAVAIASAIAVPARAADLDYPAGVCAPSDPGCRAHVRVHRYVGGPAVEVLDSQDYAAGEPAPAFALPWRATVDASCLVGRPVNNSHDDFVGYRVYDACNGVWVR